MYGFIRMKTAYLGLGSNLGDRWVHLQAAVEGLHADRRVEVTAVSPVYETEAHTKTSTEKQPRFLNAVVEITVTASPEDLLQTAKRLERAEGRTLGGERWAPRPLDVDLLVVGNVTCSTDELTLPHPRIAERRFVLRPWADLAPNLVVPSPFEASVHDMLYACGDVGSIRRISRSLVVPTSENGPGSNESR